MGVVPEIEAEFIQLNRDYNVHKTNYDSLVTRRESAAMSREMGGTAGMADFRVIDPPRVLPRPVAPNRPRLFNIALLGGLAAGLAVCFLLSQIRRRHFDAQGLRNTTGIPVLGTISLIVGQRARMKERFGLIAFAVVTVALFAAYGAGLTILGNMGLRA
jgi:hypothetical protein